MTTTPKIIEGLTLQEALEGLRDGRFVRAQPECCEHRWAEWDWSGLVHHGRSDMWVLNDVSLDPWRAEVAELKVPWHVAIAGLFSGEYSEAETGDPGRERVVARDDLLCSDGDTFCICGIDLGDWTVTPARKGGE